MRKLLVLAFVILISSNAYAACTEEGLVEKMQTFTTAWQELSQSNPQKFASLAGDMQKDMAKFQNPQEAPDMEAMCKFYDDWTARLK